MTTTSLAKTRPSTAKSRLPATLTSASKAKGDVNIYNCTAPKPEPEDQPCLPTPAECPTRRIAPGQWLPVTLGAKPKLSQRYKLDRLLVVTCVDQSNYG
jgi:hypothetical protein